MNNNLLCNYCVSSTGKSNFNVRIIKPSNQKSSNTTRILSTKIENRIKSRKRYNNRKEAIG